MERKENRKTKRVTIRLSETEYEQIFRKCKSSTCRKLSEYVRLVLFEKAVTTITRDGTMDELMGEVIRVRTELNRIGVNTNQVARRLQSLTQINEFREHLQQQEQHHEAVQNALDEAYTIINKLSDRWLQ